MTTKKGIVITAVILAVISAASFAIWIIPQNQGSTIIVSDYKSELDSVKERHSIIVSEIDSDLKGLLSKSISPDDFISKAQVSSSQVTSLISELIESNPPSEWKESYLNYDESLKKYNDYLTETMVLATKIKGGIGAIDLSDEMSKIDSLKKESDSFASRSNDTRP